ncbi:hypothetical protein [Streptomyces lutosisoli]|uniref:Uncharacterized protein n=1 Tax=Streptomyces lutosisoli TaxID=2665721 RepID=A0ABW2VUD8_9ACTN
MAARISERNDPARYRAALVREGVSRGFAADTQDSDLNDLAIVAGLRPPALPETREAVLFALECPVSFMDDGNQTIAEAVFDSVAKGRPLVVIDSHGHRFVMEPQPVQGPA